MKLITEKGIEIRDFVPHKVQNYYDIKMRMISIQR
jgi:hypothetical protein